jgi:hypothetical protein
MRMREVAAASRRPERSRAGAIRAGPLGCRVSVVERAGRARDRGAAESERSNRRRTRNGA